MERFDNGLTPAQAERLALLSEECAEAIQIINKILRHGYESFHPDDQNRVSNRGLLAQELGHVEFGLMFMARNQDIDLAVVSQSACIKGETINRWLHHQELS